SVVYASPDSTRWTPSQGIVGWNNRYMMQGDPHVGGKNYRSWCTFDPLTFGVGDRGSLIDMVSTPKIDYLQIFLYFEHWYYVDPYGGSPAHQLQNCTLGWHNDSGTLPASRPPGGFPSLFKIE